VNPVLDAIPALPNLVLYGAAALLLAVTPGPGIFYVAARTLSGGRSEGIASSIGTGIGGMAHVLAGALGVSALVLASAELFTALKLLGAVYLLWIGFRTFQAARRDAAALPDGAAAATPIGAGRAFREGILVEALNPKTAAFFLAFIPQFVDPAQGYVALQFVALGSISVVLNTLADVGVAIAAGRVRDAAAAQGRLMRRLREASGLGLIALGLGLALARRPSS
jgi:threonine/homoserine/homoserine lactone efflux protein